MIAMFKARSQAFSTGGNCGNGFKAVPIDRPSLAVGIEHGLSFLVFHVTRRLGPNENRDFWASSLCPMNPWVHFPCVAPLGMSLRQGERSGFPLWEEEGSLLLCESQALPPLPLPPCTCPPQPSLHPPSFLLYAYCPPNLSPDFHPSLLEQTTKSDNLLFSLFMEQSRHGVGKYGKGLFSEAKSSGLVRAHLTPWHRWLGIWGFISVSWGLPHLCEVFDPCTVHMSVWGGKGSPIWRYYLCGIP